MKGDFSRLTFRPRRRYSSVRLQQGRVQLDADWNEQVDIQSYHAATTAADVIGRSGAPMEDAGFGIAASGNTVTIGRGRYYVAGTLCENDDDGLSFVAQPDFPGAALPADGGYYLAYLDVWQRHLTALDRPELREVALGGPDTATRTRTTWQVRLLRIESDGEPSGQNYRDVDVPTLLYGDAVPVQLRAQAEPIAEAANECLVPPGAGYRRLENQLYRVEIHDTGSDAAAPTFKWSRDNGTLVASLSEIAGKVITVADIGRDEVLTLASAPWIEISDEGRVLRGEPGVLLEVDSVQGTAITIKAWPGDVELAKADFGAQPTVRRWDGAQLAVQPGQMVELEDGVQVELTGGQVRVGDYWLIPARSLTGDVEWPRDATGPVFEPPHGIAHRYAPLALVRFDDGVWFEVADVRRFFPPTTKLTSLFYVGGDGQAAAPGATLAQPLQAGVANGHYRVDGARVVFTITGGNGTLQGAGQSGSSVTVPTVDGVAACTWQLDTSTEHQTVEAALADGTHLPLRFSARFLRGGEADAGLHVKDVRLLGQNQELLHDVEIMPVELAEGIRVECDDDIDQRSVRGKPVMYVTLDLPFPFSSLDRDLWGGDVIGFQPLILAAGVNSDNNSIYWTPTEETRRMLSERLAYLMREFKRGERVLAHLTLKGNFIWAARDPEVFLDGTTFGARGDREQMRLRLPSGDGRRGGDFEMWFWLATERPQRPISVGIIPHGVNTDPRIGQALSMAIDRAGLRQVLPSNYEVASVAFDPALARRTFAQLSRADTALNALVVEEYAELGRLLIAMLQRNLTGDGLTVRIQMEVVPRARLEETVRTLLGIVGRRPLSMVIGDSSDAELLGRLFPNNFNGSLIAV